MAGVKTFKVEVASRSNWERIVDKNELKRVVSDEIMEVGGSYVRQDFLGFGNLFGLFACHSEWPERRMEKARNSWNCSLRCFDHNHHHLYGKTFPTVPCLKVLNASDTLR